jgi:hypothetical protein
MDGSVAEELLAGSPPAGVRLAPSVRGIDLTEVANVVLLATGGTSDLRTLIVAASELIAFAGRLRDALLARAPSPEHSSLVVQLQSETSAMTFDLRTQNSAALAEALRQLADVVDVVDSSSAS